MNEENGKEPIFLFMDFKEAVYLGLAKSSEFGALNRVFRIERNSCNHWGWYSVCDGIAPRPRYAIRPENLATVNALYKLSGDLYLATKDYLFSID